MEQETLNKPTQEERYHQETHCQSCGRFVGIYTRCPYCQALTQKRLSIRAFKVISVLTSTVGLVMLLFFARHVKTPEVKIAELGPLSNFAHVRIVAEVENSYGVHPKWGSLGFVVVQGDDENRKTMRVSAYSKVAKEIEARSLVPNKGDIVSIEGQVRFQQNSPSLLINAHEHLTFIKRSEVKEKSFQVKNVEPDKIDKSMVGQFVNVTGSVLTTKRFAGKGIIVNLDDGKSGFPVWVPANVVETDIELNSGDLIEATGKVETFKDALEVKVNRKNSFKILSRVTAPSEDSTPTSSSETAVEDSVDDSSSEGD